MTKTLKTGDWVTSYSKGIYRIEKIIENYYDESSPTLDNHTIGDKEKFRTIVSKRLFNSKFKKSFSYDSCSEYYVSPLGKTELSELNKLLAQDTNLLTEFDNFIIPTLSLIYNLPLQITNKDDKSRVLQLIEFIQTGQTFLQIKEEMGRLDILCLQPKNFGNHLLQLFNFDLEYQDKRKIWRDAKLIKQ